MHTSAEEIMALLMELDPEERPAVLEMECGGNLALREEVERLLDVAGKADAYFRSAAEGRSFARPGRDISLEKAGDRVGPYQLQQQIGEGGFGVVWMAQQERPISRRVAVKVIKAGMDSKEVLSRFDAERQALARMDHPNIARVIDAGATDAGRPYFAMDLVKGVPVTCYCDERKLDTRERLLLFGDICAAINHAHQKGVIHRDIKPNNILVTLDGDRPVVKVIDFGISKAIEGKLTERTLFTRIEQWVGTPVYMSPEQTGLGSLDVDTRSDIYSLGVVLYELLTGETPFDQATMARVGMEEMRRIIREVEPPRPSVRVTSSQGVDGDGRLAVSRDGMRSTVANELDWIVMKAIDKSRDRRYPTAAALADDIGRFLADEPVMARPPGTFYLFSKFSKRHRRALRVAGAVGIVLVATTLFSSWQAVRATRAEALAASRLAEAVRERNAKAVALQDAEAVSRLLTEVFKRPDPTADGRKVTMVEALDAASGKLDAELADQPDRLAMLSEVLAVTYEGLVLPDEALPLREKVLAIRRREPGMEKAVLLGALRRTIESNERLGHFPRSKELAIEELALLRGGPSVDDAAVRLALRSLAKAGFRTGDREAAVGYQQELLAICVAGDGEKSNSAEFAAWELREYQEAKGPQQEPAPEPQPGAGTAEPLSRAQLDLRNAETAYAGSVKTLGASHVRTLELMSSLADAQARNGNQDKAITTMIQVVALAQKNYTPSSDLALGYHIKLSDMYYAFNQGVEAIRVRTEATALICERDGETARSTMDNEDRLMRMMHYHANNDDYLKLLEDTLTRRKRMLGLANGYTMSVQADLILKCLRVGKLDQGIAYGEEIVPVMRIHCGAKDRGTVDAMGNLARCYASAGRTREAMDLLVEGCPYMTDDTYMNLLLASLQVWTGKREGYDETRRWMIDASGFMGDAAILERSVWLSCLTPLEDEEQGKVLLETIRRIEDIRNRPGAQVDLKHAPDLRARYKAMALFRTGDFKGALEQFEFSEKFMDAQAKAELAAGRRPYAWAAVYKALALHRLGREDDARDLYRDLLKHHPVPPSKENPLVGKNDVDGSQLMVWIALEEASNVFEAMKSR